MCSVLRSIIAEKLTFQDVLEIGTILFSAALRAIRAHPYMVELGRYLVDQVRLICDNTCFEVAFFRAFCADACAGEICAAGVCEAAVDDY